MLYNTNILTQVMVEVVVLLVCKVVKSTSFFHTYTECSPSPRLASGTGLFIEYSYDLANAIQPNTTITFDTNLGIYTNGTF